MKAKKKKRKQHPGGGLPQLPSTKVSKKPQAWAQTLAGRFGDTFGVSQEGPNATVGDFRQSSQRGAMIQ